MIYFLGVALLVSIALNTFLLWYGRKVVKDLLFVSDSYGDLAEVLEEFREHLKIVYSMETFYGDETLKNLILHSRDVNRFLERFERIYSLTEPYDLDEEEEEEYFDDEEQFPEEKEKTTQRGKTVFYSGA